MNKLCKIFLCFLLILICGCQINQKEDLSAKEEALLKEKTTDSWSNYVLIKINAVASKYVDESNKPIHVIEATVIHNYNDTININNKYSEYINEKIENEQRIKLMISDVYINYLVVGDMFIYQLNECVKIQKSDNYYLAFSTLNNEQTLLPVCKDVFAMENVSSHCQYPEDDYLIFKRIMQRTNYYRLTLSNYIIDNSEEEIDACFDDLSNRIEVFNLLISKLFEVSISKQKYTPFDYNNLVSELINTGGDNND